MADENPNGQQAGPSFYGVFQHTSVVLMGLGGGQRQMVGQLASLTSPRCCKAGTGLKSLA